MSKNMLDNDTFVGEKLEELVKKYPHQKIVISNGKIFTGDNAVKLARKRFPEITPLLFPVPGPEEFAHLLLMR